MAKGTSLTYSLLILSIKIGCKIDHRCHDHDHRSGRHIGKIRNDQSHDSGKETKDHGIEVIFLHVFRYIPAGCRWQDQKGIDEQNTDPLDRQCHNERNDNSKDILHQTHGNIAALCQGCMDADSIQLVDGKAPEYQSHRKDQDQIDDLPRRNAQDISHQNSGILAKIAPLG